MDDDTVPGTTYRAATQYVDDEARDYNQNRNASSYQRWKWNAELATMRDTLRTLVGTGGTVLDAPTGTGRAIPVITEIGSSVIGCDISMDMIRLAIRTSDSTVPPMACAAVEMLPFRDSSIDIVTCLRLFQHLPESAVLAALDEFTRVSGQGVLVQVPLLNRASPVVRWVGSALAQHTLNPSLSRPSGRMFPMPADAFDDWLRRHDMMLQSSRVVTWRLGQLRLLHITREPADTAPR